MRRSKERAVGFAAPGSKVALHSDKGTVAWPTLSNVGLHAGNDAA